MIPQFDIFEGEPGESSAMWIDAVVSLDAAHETLLALAVEKPGKYFVFCARTHETISAIDTSESALAKVR
jgi:hypothetical protein